MKSIALLSLLVFSNPSLALASTLPALPPCASSDVGCLKLHLDDQLQQIAALTIANQSLTGELSLSQQAQKIASDSATVANSYAQKILSETKNHWWDAPALWFALGGFVVGAVAIGLAAAFAHVTR